MVSQRPLRPHPRNYDRRAMLLAMAEAGFTAREMAAECGITPNAVNTDLGRFRREGIPIPKLGGFRLGRPKDWDRYALVYAMAVAGCTNPEIMAVAGYKLKTEVSNALGRLRAHGVPTPRRGPGG